MLEQYVAPQDGPVESLVSSVASGIEAFGQALSRSVRSILGPVTPAAPAQAGVAVLPLLILGGVVLYLATRRR